MNVTSHWNKKFHSKKNTLGHVWLYQKLLHAMFGFTVIDPAVFLKRRFLKFLYIFIIFGIISPLGQVPHQNTLELPSTEEASWRKSKKIIDKSTPFQKFIHLNLQIKWNTDYYQQGSLYNLVYKHHVQESWNELSQI